MNAFFQTLKSLANSLQHTIECSGRILSARLDHVESGEEERLNAKEIVFNTIKYKMFNSLGL